MTFPRIDPRYFQIVTLTTLLLFQVGGAFAPRISVVSVVFGAALLTQIIGWYVFLRTKDIAFDARSPLITALSLSILLKAAALPMFAIAAAAAIGSKFLLRAGGKHIFNPANIGIVAVFLAFPNAAWVTPGQWGNDVLLGLFLICMAFIVLYRIRSRSVSILFISMWAALVFGRALWLGDPVSIPVHQMQNGAFLIFAFFMISDPKTVPDHAFARLVFCALVAVIGFALQFGFFIREGLFYELALVCAVRPIMEHIWTARAYTWRGTCIEE